MTTSRLNIPVLVTGAANSGKTHFIAALSEINVVLRQATPGTPPPFNIPLEFARRVLVPEPQQLTLTLYASLAARPMPPMEQRMAPPSDAYCGYVVLADSLAPTDALFSSHAATAKLLRQIVARGRPTIVVANKQDDPAALSLDALRLLLDMPDDLPLYPGVTHNRLSVRDRVLDLLALLPQDDPVVQAQTALRALTFGTE